MTDITELAQSLKAAAEKATPGPWEVQFGEEIYATDGVDNEQVAIATLDARDADYIAQANPANILALEKALEKAQQRIAELESRTVKLPDLRQIVSGDRYVWSDGVYNYSQDVKVELAAAGIKVEAE
ncbi:TPA: ead/Ea22-like family protein [Klebsiella pneumoniae]|nr:ead/Ea22-like family protein [Klebsiella pneumoniae]HBS8206262.1 ead/Ea22-like family protein [Klebsiella pneumoniae]HEB5100179.1 ead/Ea22-like family protein [Klebsiella pneumoniae]HEB5102133.1 ead/Ea22-like family protein [Klebsiella pneumoniae]HEB5123047.1 ead/Ea22-like family protein [Klebsiella pneumoniae]